MYSYTLEQILPSDRKEFLELVKKKTSTNRIKGLQYSVSFYMGKVPYTFKERDIEFLTEKEKNKFIPNYASLIDNKEPKSSSISKRYNRNRTDRSLPIGDNYHCLPHTTSEKRELNNFRFIKTLCEHRVVFKEDLNNIYDFIMRISNMENSNSTRSARRTEYLWYFKEPNHKLKNPPSNTLLTDPIIFYNCAKVEGLNFNQQENDPYLIDFRGIKFLKVKNFYFTTGNYTNVLVWLESKETSLEEFTTKMISKLTREFKVSISEKLKNLETIQNKVFKIKKQLGELQLATKSINKFGSELIIKTIGKINTIPEVETIKIIGSGFEIITKDLWCEYESKDEEGKIKAGKKLYFGKYELIMDILNRNTFMFRNIAAPNKRSQHPHSSLDRIDGRICLGGYEHILQSCLQEVDYFTFVLTAITLLKNTNGNDYDANHQIQKLKLFRNNKPKELYCFPNYINVFGIINRVVEAEAILTTMEEEGENYDEDDERDDEDDEREYDESDREYDERYN